MCCIQVYEGHSGIVQCVCVEPDGQWLASAASDGSVKLWEVATARCIRTLMFDSKPLALAFCPNPTHSLLAIAVSVNQLMCLVLLLHCLVLVNCRGEQIFVINSEVGDYLTVKCTAGFLGELTFSAGEPSSAEHVEWGRREGGGVHITHRTQVQQCCWHGKGDYIAVVTANGRQCWEEYLGIMCISYWL